MTKPYIFCHMITSIDGKIDGTHKSLPKRGENALDFYQLAFGDDAYYQLDGWISGRVTSEIAFTKGNPPILEISRESVPEGDYIAQCDLSKYYVSIDTSGKLGWQESTVQYRDTSAHIIEVLTEQASNSYKVMLRKLGISYVIAGVETLDIPLLLEKLNEKFNINSLMLGGGGVLNWAFIQAGVCDEISMLIAPFADGSSSTHSIFQTKEGITRDIPVSFKLEQIKKIEHDGVWLRYKVQNTI